MTATTFAPLPVDDGPAKPPPVVQSPLAAVLASTIALGAATQHRNLQTVIGASEVGHECDRHLSYRLHNVVGTGAGGEDPMRSLTGTGVHSVLEEMFGRLAAGSGRYLTEIGVYYRSIPGHVDLYDAYLATVIDWKTTSKARIAEYIKNGPPRSYQVQIQMYAAGLQELGFEVRDCAVAFLPYDGALSGLWTWQAPPDRTIADAAVDRLHQLGQVEPVDTQITPSRLCAYCPYYNPRATDPRVGCAAKKG